MQFFADSAQRWHFYSFILHSFGGEVQFLSSFLLLEILNRANRSDSTRQGRNVCGDVSALHPNSFNPFCISVFVFFSFFLNLPSLVFLICLNFNILEYLRNVCDVAATLLDSIRTIWRHWLKSIKIAWCDKLMCGVTLLYRNQYKQFELTGWSLSNLSGICLLHRWFWPFEISSVRKLSKYLLLSILNWTSKLECVW